MGRARIAVPSELVDSIIEMELAPAPPLARNWVGGLGYHEKKVVVCVSLVPQSATAKVPMKRTVKGVLCRVKDSDVLWMLEVGVVRAFVQVKLLPPRAPAPNEPVPSWIVGAVTADRKAVGLVDVESMVRELAGTA